MASLTLSLIIFIILICAVEGRLIRLNTPNHLVSDGVDDVNQLSPFLPLNGLSSSPGGCTHDYGFLPCADNVGGYIYQLVIYQFLLFVGGHFITNGSKKLFTMLGTGIFGASVFRVLLVLPRIMFVIVSGLYSSKEEAQRQVSLGVAIYAGSTVFCLTLLWATCVIVGSKDLPERQSRTDSSTSERLLAKETCSDLKGKGVKTDEDTSLTAGIMLLSLVPYAILQLVNVFNSESASRLVMLIALVVSTMFLLAYFSYQVFDHRFQKRSLEYSKYEKLVHEFLQYARKHAEYNLVNDKGQPNVPAIDRFFSEADTDNNNFLSIQELEKMLEGMDSGELQGNREFALAQLVTEFDRSRDGKVNHQEFVNGLMKLRNEDKQIPTTGKFMSEIVKPFTQRKQKELEKIEELAGKIMQRVQRQALEGLLDEDGRVNTEGVKKLFSELDTDQSHYISRDELRRLLPSYRPGGEQAADDATVDQWMRQLDEDRNDMISEQEFINGMKVWLKKPTKEDVTKETQQTTKSSDGNQISWDEVDRKLFNYSAAWALCKPLSEIILGVTMLTFLAEPFGKSIVQLSDAMGLSTFVISFVVVPIVANAKTAISTIFPIRQQCDKTSSLTFSEIYGEVVMNNIMGLTTLLAIVYAKDLAWNYSAEVLIIFLICGVVGLIGYSCNTYHLWSSILAIFMYIFSLALFYVLQYFWGWD